MRLSVWTLVILTLFLAVQTLSAYKEWRGPGQMYNSISVNGEGEVIVVPDVAVFSFTVSADAGAVSDAQSEVTRKMNAINDALKELGVEEKDIKTTNYSVWPKYVYRSEPCTPTYCPPSRQVADGFTVSHTVEIKVRQTEDAGRALGIAGTQGATNISGISFTVDDPDQALEEARALAIADAKAKAKSLSKNLGVRLVRIVHYQDTTNGYRPMPLGLGSADMVRMEADTPSIPQGENKVRINVTVTYEIR